MKVEFHAHSNFSDGKPDPVDMVKHAKKMGLDAIAITDHNEIMGSLKAKEADIEGIEVITGAEITSKEGHILSLGVDELVPAGLSAKDTVDAIHALKGFAIAAHPYDVYRKGVGDCILHLDFDGVEIVNGHTFGSKKDVSALCDGLGLRKIGGSDAHTLDEIGMVYCEFKGGWREGLRAEECIIHSKHVFSRAFMHGWGLLERHGLKKTLKRGLKLLK